MIVAIVGIETYFGTRMGKYRVLDALATLAFAYPPRAAFFTSRARGVPAAHRARSRSIRPRRSARMRARWARASSFRRAIALTPSTPMPTASAISGPTGTTSSAASRTTSRSTAGAPASPSWSRPRGPSASRDRSPATASISATPSARWPSWATCSRRRCRPTRRRRRIRSRPQAAGRSIGSATTTSTS